MCATALMLTTIGLSGSALQAPAPAPTPAPAFWSYSYIPGRYLDDLLAAEWLNRHYGATNAAEYFGIPYGRRGVASSRVRTGTVRLVAEGLVEPVIVESSGEAEYPLPTGSVSGKPVAGSNWQRWHDRTFPRTYQ